MAKTIGYRLFRLGRIPARWHDELNSEGIRILDEGIRQTITYRNYHAPGRYFAWRRSMGSGAIVVTEKQFLVFYYRWPVLDIGRDDPRIVQLDVSSPAPDMLVLSFEASDFDSRRRGSVTIRLRSAEVPSILQALGPRG